MNILAALVSDGTGNYGLISLPPACHVLATHATQSSSVLVPLEDELALCQRRALVEHMYPPHLGATPIRPD